MKKLPQLILFDLDGTLIEFHREYLFTRTATVLEKMAHPPVSREDLERHFSLFDYFSFVVHDDRDTFVKEFWRHYDQDCDYPAAELIQTSHDVLSELQRWEIPLAIVTARTMPQEKLREYLQPTGLLDFMEHVRARDLNDKSHWSDKKHMLTETIGRFGVSPEVTMMVGDIPADISSAKAVGVGETVAVKSGGILEEVLAREAPDVILPDIGHLLDYLSKRTR